MEMRTCHRVEANTLIVDLGRPCAVISSAPRGGGLVRSRYILNHQVAANPISPSARTPAVVYEDPARYLGRIARDLGVERRCVGLMTAVSLKHLVRVREEYEGLWVEGFCTVGLTNAVRAGESIVTDNHVSCPGTINIVLVTNARLPASAMVGAVQVATESKTAAVLAAEIVSWNGLPGATGTGTDATVIASGHGLFYGYCGTHTAIGAMIARVVSDGIQEGMEIWKKWKNQEQKSAQRGY
jgi:adenosylcobinamide hydrolase